VVLLKSGIYVIVTYQSSKVNEAALKVSSLRKSAAEKNVGNN
jgi:hypothetical protein